MSFEFAQSICIQFRASRYITGLNRIMELKVLVVCICYELLFSILSVSIYFRTQSDIRVKSYYGLNFQRASVFNSERLDILLDSIGHRSKNLLSFELNRASVFNYERLDILWDSNRHPCKNLLSFEFATNFHFQLRASRYIMGLNRTSE